MGKGATQKTAAVPLPDMAVTITPHVELAGAVVLNIGIANTKLKSAVLTADRSCFPPPEVALTVQPVVGHTSQSVELALTVYPYSVALQPQCRVKPVTVTAPRILEEAPTVVTTNPEPPVTAQLSPAQPSPSLITDEKAADASASAAPKKSPAAKAVPDPATSVAAPMPKGPKTRLGFERLQASCSLQDCLAAFTDPEELTGSNLYGCVNCTRLAAQHPVNALGLPLAEAASHASAAAAPAAIVDKVATPGSEEKKRDAGNVDGEAGDEKGDAESASGSSDEDAPAPIKTLIKQPARKRLLLHRLPRILTLHLKR